ncbi:membrane protein [Puniceibacterium sp. IMCC21224]|uniref:membrane protein n=1 Tax=Puniceibacterium sp. IMCC21224 TaxID=1618204 RepID=UPI00064D91B0|nr:membrane protein [Puniceibacterium sp. IMCC21224]KMK65658.1 O-antigen ligase like membrane protein [Puniceibacterium sp. IMCC21224]
MPNPIAFAMLAIWPLVTVALFRRFEAERALILSLLVGYLFLPEVPAVFDLPLFPPLNKHNLPALSAFVCCLWMYGVRGSVLPESVAGKVLLLTFVLSPIATVATNGDPVLYGQVGLPALGLKDMVALTLQQFLLILPFLLARQFLTQGGAQRELLIAFMVGGLVYSVLMLIEIRLSPQLNLWVYGYYQHYFGQSIRGGGYRPVVFLYHGLWVAFFTMTAVVSAFALWRMDARTNRSGFLLAALYLSAILVLAKSLGALIFAVALVPCVLLLSRVMQIKVAILIGALAVSYPILKGADLVPQDRLLQQAASIDPERAASLQFRFDNENILLDRAYRKPVFGWGSWGRNHILDPVSGNILTVTDGRWIIVIGVYGWVGFLAEFGLLLLPLLLLWRETTVAHEGDISPFIAPLSLLLAVNIFDMLPNATLTPLTWLIAGCLMGYAEALKAARMKSGNMRALRWQSIL